MFSSGNETSLYRHFKGGYYIVHSVAREESTGETVVVYQSLQDGKVWVRPISVFNELVPEDKENPTGQKYRFEKVTNFNNQLKMVSTENLMKELFSRDDCPADLQTYSDKVWKIEYLVGRFDTIYVDHTTSYEDFHILNTYSTYERAVKYAQDHPQHQILKKVYIKQDFD